VSQNRGAARDCREEPQKLEGDIARSDRQAAPEGAAFRREIERWFVRRGVPQFIEGYGTEQSMDRRATPLILGWLVAWAALFWFSRPEAPFPWNALAVAGTMVFFTFADAFTDALRGRSLRRVPAKYDLVDIGQFAVLPVIPTLLVQQDPLALLFSALNVLLGIGVIYLVIGFGLIDIAVWALDRLRDQLVHIATLVSRTLPLLLILVVFLMFAAELWEAAHSLHAGELAAVVALLLSVGSVLILSTFRAEVERLEGAHDWPEVRVDAASTPAARLADRPVPDGYRVPRLAWLERRNVEFVVLVNQLLQSTFVSLIVFAFLVVFGLIVVPAAVQAAWIGGPVTVLAELHVLGEPRALSAELVTVSALLSGIVGLYFTGLALTDATYRAEHFTAVVGELRMLLAARALYRAALFGTPRTRTPAGAAASDAAAPTQGR
jgi:hypothetical protein